MVHEYFTPIGAYWDLYFIETYCCNFLDHMAHISKLFYSNRFILTKGWGQHKWCRLPAQQQFRPVFFQLDRLNMERRWSLSCQVFPYGSRSILLNRCIGALSIPYTGRITFKTSTSSNPISFTSYIYTGHLRILLFITNAFCDFICREDQTVHDTYREPFARQVLFYGAGPPVISLCYLSSHAATHGQDNFVPSGFIKSTKRDIYNRWASASSALNILKRPIFKTVCSSSNFVYFYIFLPPSPLIVRRATGIYISYGVSNITVFFPFFFFSWFGCESIAFLKWTVLLFHRRNVPHLTRRSTLFRLPPLCPFHFCSRLPTHSFSIH